ncbi:MAG TPA: DUF2069 domain-containing protein [Povalibacter sp.]|nr:DUF2069 domain-containing protein [Povalibacter sp.]
MRGAAIALDSALICLVIAWQLATDVSLQRLLLAVVLTLPLWAPLPGLIRGNRRTYAWATLCVIPYFVLSLTEAIANPHGRGWSSACLGLALALFMVLIAYLRVSRKEAVSG